MSNGNVLHPDRAAARHSDPDTSHAAAQSVHLRRAQTIVLKAALEAHQTIGTFTDDDLIGLVANKLSDSGVRSRWCELDRDHGFIKPTGQKRRNKNGRRARLHELTPLGRAHAERVELS